MQFLHRVENLRDAENLSASRQTPLEFRAARPGVVDLCIDGRDLGDMHIWTTRSSNGFVTTPWIDRAVVSVRFVLSGRLTRRNVDGMVLAHPGVGILQTFTPEREEEVSSGFEAIATTIQRPMLARHFQALEGADPGCLPDFAPVADLAIPGVRAFMRSLIIAHGRALEPAGAEEQGDALGLLREVMLYQLLGAWPRQPHREPDNQPLPPSRRLRTALDFIDAHIGGRLRLADVAAATGVSVRSLQTLFRKELGKTVVQSITEHRLDKAHQDLVTEVDPSIHISQIAYRWGFLHLSDFSRRYRERFGHLPSETKRSRRLH